MLFTDETKKLILSYVIACLIPVAFVIPMYFYTDLGLSNELLIVAMCYLGYTGLYLVTRAGIFDVFRFQFINWISSFRRGGKVLYPDMQQYRERLQEKRHMARQLWIPWCVIGTICLILCIIFAYFPI